jgi:hypothetical protein
LDVGGKKERKKQQQQLGNAIHLDFLKTGL